ncbi:phage minor head protein [Bacillus cereus]|uniref:phage minor head protein n=1 Tax=Bacillus cereus TaxID=1396 RepID=UPI0028530E54|nr:phage minor head protein [Bacillus cereus]MDR4987171.1 phage minor head protein [Bacillus cereus]
MNLFDIFKLINRRIGQLIKKAERAIARIYAKTLVEIRKQMAEQYEKYEQNGELTLEEMLKYDRLNKLNKRINWIMGVNHKEVSKQMTKVLGEVYKDGYYLTAWGVETTTRTKLGYASVRPESLTAMLQNPVAGLTLKSRLEKNRADIIHKIQQEVTQGLQENETYSKMAKRLKDSLEGDVVKATRIVRTEGHRVQESAKHDAAEHANKNGVIMLKQWNTLEDERVRPGRGIGKKDGKGKANHRKLNNQKIPMDALFDDGLSKGPAPGLLAAAGSSINCRCLLTYTVERIERPNHQELENMAFEEWEKERLAP